MGKTSNGLRRVAETLIITSLIFLPGTVPFLFAESSVAVHVNPSISFPLGDSADLFSTGGGMDLFGEYRLFSDKPYYLMAGLSYGYLPVRSERSISTASVEAGAGLFMDMSPRFGLKAFASGGYYYGMWNDNPSTSSMNPRIRSGLGFRFILTPFIDITLSGSYESCLGLYHGVRAMVGSTLYLSGRNVRRESMDSAFSLRPDLYGDARKPLPGRGIEVGTISLDDLFPVFFRYYDTQPLGRITLRNLEDKTLEDVKLTFFIRQYMDVPKESSVPSSIEPGEEIDADILALLTEKILDVTEGTAVASEIVVEYRMDGHLYRDVKNATVRVLDRNAMTWDDDRKAAAFITAKDPAVMTFSRNVMGAIRDRGSTALNRTLSTAMAIHNALDLYGITYAVDPRSPHAELSQDVLAVDYLLFPRQTLEYRAGDCDDLSILYSALLEAVGIETAFVTVPGHIFLAFSTGLSAREASRHFLTTADLIIREGMVWVPVEITERQSGFMEAWRQGARQWREHDSRSSAGFFPVHEAWEIFEPVGLPGNTVMVMPSDDAVASAFLEESLKFVDREILPRITRLEEEVIRRPDDPVLRNRLGISYAQYGYQDKAVEQFRRSLALRDSAPSHINLGNIFYLRRDWIQALGSYERALRLQPENPLVLVSLARTFHQMEDHTEVGALYARVKELNPAMADQFAYLDSAFDSGSRASETALMREVVLWEE